MVKPPFDEWGEREPRSIEGSEEEILSASRRRTRRAFVVGGAAAAAGYGIWRAIGSGMEIGRQPPALRRVFQANAGLARTVFDERGLAPTYPLSKAKPLRLNGTIGMGETLKLDSWRLQMVGVEGAARHPRFVPDVTAWEYQYEGDTKPDAQANDVKSAPGNGPKTKTGKDKGSAPPDQKSADAGNGKGDRATPPEAGTQEPGAGAGSGQPADDAASASVSVEQNFKIAPQKGNRKRRQGSDEAGPSSSSLDIGTPGLLLTMDDLLRLPRVEMVMEFKCIEGWSEIVQWAGVRLRDLLDAHPPEKVNGREPAFVYMETPDGDYYGGYDMNACRHPQSLLVTEIGGQPLTQEHGAPLRLFMPIKYGYKQLKRIGLIAYTETRPDDYWTKLGYDWYAGL